MKQYSCQMIPPLIRQTSTMINNNISKIFLIFLISLNIDFTFPKLELHWWACKEVYITIKLLSYIKTALVTFIFKKWMNFCIYIIITHLEISQIIYSQKFQFFTNLFSCGTPNVILMKLQMILWFTAGIKDVGRDNSLEKFKRNSFTF